jgi:translation initiation factor IF-3
LLRFSEVRVVDNEGKQVGVLGTRDALRRAQDEGLDLILVAGAATPPVVRIADYGRYKYEKAKLEKDKKPKKQDVKGIKISPMTAEHDLQVAVRKCIQFLGEGHKVRLVCRFRKRQLTHPEVGRAKLMKIMDAIGEAGKAERDPALAGLEMVLVINPKAAGGSKKNVKAEDKQDSGEEI